MSAIVLMVIGMFRTTEWIVFAAIAAAVFLAGMGTHKVFADRKLAIVKEQHAQQREQWAQASAESQKKARETETALQDKADAAERKAADERKQLETRFTRIAADNDRLRNLANHRASGTDQDSLAACRADAAALRDVFTDAARVAAEMARTAEQHASEVRLLLEGWPQ